MYQLEREITEILPKISSEQLTSLFRLFHRYEREAQEQTIRSISEALGRTVAETAAFVMEKWARPLPVPVARIFASAAAKASALPSTEDV